MSKRLKVKEIYLDEDIGLIFVTEDNKEHAIKYYYDASGAISGIDIFVQLHLNEKYCTGNLNRECRICGRKPDARPMLKVLVKYFKKQVYIPPKSESGGIPADQIKIPKIEDIMDKVDNCPACALTIIRALKLQKYSLDIDFVYKKEIEKWWGKKG